MKTVTLFIILIFYTLGVYSQIQNSDSLKTLILQEVTTLINQSELKTENNVKQLSEQLKQIVESNNSVVTNDAASGLANSAKEEAIQQANEIVEGKAEKILAEVEKMLNQSKSELIQEIGRAIQESNKQSSENFEVAIHNSEENSHKRATELIDEKFSSIHQFIIENIESENQNLMDKINEQGDLISELLKRVEELEKK